MVDDSVKVALRIRPLVPTEIEKGCQTCLATVPSRSQVQVLGTDKAFTYDHVFSPDVDQETFYKTAIGGMIDNLFQGYNVTILAYGQTGSGKTHSMGMCSSGGIDEMGVIPRAINNIFEIVGKKTARDFKVTISFMELYQEQLYDLLSEKARENCIVDIREDAHGIEIPGVTEISVKNTATTLQYLAQGSLGRATVATAMNSRSSRSHAIFTVNIYQQRKDDATTTTTAKFHVIDLAGSECSKKTKATCKRFKEGANIKIGLLALEKLIWQLGDGNSSNYIDYRDSELTRLLQDSLGGNSMTLMIACVSPADYNLDETMSTLRHADRARRIKNKPIVNQEFGLALLSQGTNVNGDFVHPSEHKELQAKVQSLQTKNRDLAEQLNSNSIEFLHMKERAELAEAAIETIKTKRAELLKEVKSVIHIFDSNPYETNEHRAALVAIYNKILDHEAAGSNFADDDSAEADPTRKEHMLQQAVRTNQEETRDSLRTVPNGSPKNFLLECHSDTDDIAYSKTT